MATLSQTSENKYWQYALWLALFTIFYNFAEGLISTFFGAQDETLTLFGFGVDSFIEVMSGLGILAMVIRILKNPNTSRSQFEQTALRITGTSFYLLAIGLGVTGIYNLFTVHKPTTTLPGLIISLISIVACGHWWWASAKWVGRLIHLPFWQTPIAQWFAFICQSFCWCRVLSINSLVLV